MKQARMKRLLGVNKIKNTKKNTKKGRPVKKTRKGTVKCRFEEMIVVMGWGKVLRCKGFLCSGEGTDNLLLWVLKETKDLPLYDPLLYFFPPFFIIIGH